MFLAAYRHYILNLPYADTSLKLSLFLVLRVSAYGRFDCGRPFSNPRRISDKLNKLINFKQVTELFGVSRFFGWS